MSETTGQVRFLRVAAVATRIGASESKVRIMIRKKLIAAERDGERGMYLVPETECDRYLADRRARSAA
ncbi:hypothetical protein Caci_2889 [Catenulispora acidiphila DSM 44928]|uniref:DNA-binding protein Rv2175c wHTH domain-containing protein n=1 Tax=Catenulispora acidiphila (strain DSM 44928 / JCM 14897 / NBRC 102108 / NRRL B-24433 / ID139908) TaxID=479433 RepID=C7Q2Q6_CATAD|nr:hypothetical protein [Catenulispora acidiphila]ACU71798.1 hypothetical protein Caci_2889 [Catenulispora acidiphila DSM 44928]